MHHKNYTESQFGICKVIDLTLQQAQLLHVKAVWNLQEDRVKPFFKRSDGTPYKFYLTTQKLQEKGSWQFER